MTYQNKFLISPAGYGKTYFISDSIRSKSSVGKILILTHTNAGIETIKSRLIKYNIPSKEYYLSTIASWCLKYVVAFYSDSGFSDANPSGGGWNQVYPSMEKILELRSVRNIILSTYSEIYVDEYQDCTLSQNRVIVMLSKFIQCTVVGDPLQGIFEFGNEPLVDMIPDLTSESFNRIKDLDIPWRWRKANNDVLGNWLADVRNKLETGMQIDLRQAPKCVKYFQSNPYNQRLVCQNFLGVSESVVAIHNFPNQCHAFARTLGGRYQSMDEIEGKDLMKFCLDIEDPRVSMKVLAIIKICCNFATTVSSELRPYILKIQQNQPINNLKKHQRLTLKMLDYLQDPKISKVNGLIAEILSINNVKIFRKELLIDLERTISLYQTGNYLSLTKAAWHIRNNLRFSSKYKFSKVISRTLLIKGMEFDHAILLDADALDKKNFYVAITRGTKSLTILSRSPIIVK